METLAYLHLAQENEDSEAKGLAINSLRSAQNVAIGAVVFAVDGIAGPETISALGVGADV